MLGEVLNLSTVIVYIAVGIGLIPSLSWLLFYLREHKANPEPKWMLLWTFILGAAATVVALSVQIPLDGLLPAIGVAKYSAVALLSFSFIEEVLKFAVVYFFISRTRYFDEPVDAMIYLVTAALGFAAVENVGAALNQWQEYAAVGAMVNAVTLRFIGATLLHSLSSGLLGYYWAEGKRQAHQSLFLIEGLLWASLLHAIFNYLIIVASVIIIPTMFLLVLGLFVLNDFEKVKGWWAKPAI